MDQLSRKLNRRSWIPTNHFLCYVLIWSYYCPPMLQDNLSAVDILSACNLVNYFGKMDLGGSGVGQIALHPILIRKVCLWMSSVRGFWVWSMDLYLTTCFAGFNINCSLWSWEYQRWTVEQNVSSINFRSFSELSGCLTRQILIVFLLVLEDTTCCAMDATWGSGRVSSVRLVQHFGTSPK